MANIREVSAPDLSLRPDDRAAESLANSGRRIAALYNQQGEAKSDTGRKIAGVVTDVGGVVVKAAEHREVSQGAAEAAKTLAGLDKEWNDTVAKADPNDPSVGAKFREERVEAALQKMKDGYLTEGGQKFAESQVQSFRNHFVSKTSADMARLASVAAKKNIETLTNQLSNAAISDPTSLNTSLKLVESSVGAMVDSSPNLKGVDSATMKLELTLDAQKSIVKSAAIGAINANPEAGVKEFSSPKYSKYINGGELKQLQQAAETVKRAQRVDENYARANAKLAAQDASDKAEGAYLEKVYSDDPKQRASVSAAQVARDYSLTREARERMIGIVQRSTEPEPAARISNQTASGLISRMRLPEGDPRRVADLGPVYDEYEKGNLTKSDLKFVRDELKEQRTPEGEPLSRDRAHFFKQYAGAIAGRAFDPVLGSPKIYQAELDARRMEQDLRKKGLDPHLAYDPSSEYFLGKPSRLQKYQGSMQGDLTDKANTPAAPARNDVMPAIPAAAARDVGSVYDTPKGPLKWTGTGWVKP